MSSDERILPDTYLVFKLGEKSLCFQACFLWEVANRTAMTEVPRTTDFLIGVAQVHGKIVPVVDLAGLLGLPQPEAHQAGGFVVVTLPGPKPILAGFHVQSVTGFARITQEEVRSFQPGLDGASIPFLAGWGRDRAGENIFLIQMDQLIASQSRGRPRDGALSSAGAEG